LAIETAMQEQYGDRCSTAIINPLREEGSPSIYQTVTEQRYDDLVQNDPGLYELTYRVSDSIATAAVIEQVSSALLYSTLKHIMERHHPDVVVCTHPLYLEPLNFVFARVGKAVPLVTVVTDLVTVHTIWFNPRVSLCVAPTKQALKKALRNGVPRDRIHVTGLPVHPRFGAETRPPAEIRAELGWEPDGVTVLIVGGTRVANVLGIARLIDRAGLKIQLAIVGGNDEELYAQLVDEPWQGNVHVYGFAGNMPALIRASDVVVTKAGGIIVSEALACGRPLILSSAIPGQETGNVEYVTAGGAGDWAGSPTDVLASLVRWLEPDTTVLEERTAKAHRLGRPDAVYKSADLIWELANSDPVPAPRDVNLRSAARLPLLASAQVSRAIDRLEQEMRDVTDTEMAKLAAWCVSQIETVSELERINNVLRRRKTKLRSK
jgi:1,2-diacylglycerol 3-beta-galactosyltransferase